MKTLIVTAIAAVGIALSVAHGAPLPEAKPDDVGFSEQGLSRLDDFFAREIGARRVPGAVVAIARDGKLVHYKAYGALDPIRGTPMPLDAVFALCLHDQADGGGRRADAHGAGPPAASGKTFGLFCGIRRHEGGRAA